VNQIRLYELLKARENMGGVLEISLNSLKLKLGIDKKQYPRWNNFKTRVIEPCRLALIEHTDLRFTYTPIKNGNRIIGVKFQMYTIDSG
jgi:plasmid replication initiation protein